MRPFLHLLLRLIRKLLLTKNRFTGKAVQLWRAVWVLLRRWAPHMGHSTVEHEQTETQTSVGHQSTSSLAEFGGQGTVICASYVPQSAAFASHPNLPSTSRPSLPTIPRTASFTSLSSQNVAPESNVTVTASISHLGIRAVKGDAQSVDNLSLASDRLSIIQANAKQKIHGLSRTPSPAPMRDPQIFLAGDKPRPSSPSAISSRVPSRTPSRAPSRASSRTDSLRPASPSRPHSWSFYEAGSQSPGSDNSDVVIDVHFRLPSEGSSPTVTVAPGSEPQSPSVTDSGQSSVVDTHMEKPSEASQTMHGSTDSLLPEPLPGRVRRPLLTSQILRHEREYKISELFYIRHAIPPLNTDWPHYGDCGDWTPITHPEGALYFHDSQRHIFTDIYMFDLVLREEVEAFVAHLNDLVTAHGKALPPNHDLVLEMETYDGPEILWGYYYVDHDTQSLFWLEDYSYLRLTKPVGGFLSFAHAKLAVDAQYWSHWSYFPIGSYEFPKEKSQELLGILTSNAIDSLTSSSSVSPYDLDKLLKMIALVKKSDFDGPAYAYTVTSTAKLLSFFSRWRFSNFHGERCARLRIGQSVYAKYEVRTNLIVFLSPLLFWAPEAHFRDIEKLWVDEMLNHAQWKNFVSKLQREWTEFVQYASILLTANMAFLAIPAVTPQDGVPPTSPAQTCSNLSVASSVGSILLGLLLVRQNRTKSRADVTEAENFLRSRSQSKMGFESLAIIHSLPYALLMWALVMYLLAFAVFCFWDTRLRTRIPVGAISLAILSLILWCIVSAGDTSGEDGMAAWFNGILRTLARRRERRRRQQKHKRNPPLATDYPYYQSPVQASLRPRPKSFVVV